MGFDAGSITAQMDIDLGLFSTKLADAESRLDRLTNARRVIRLQPVLQQGDLNQARAQLARFDEQLNRDAVARQRSGRGILAGMLGHATGAGAGASLFGGLVGGGGSAAATQSAVRQAMARFDQQMAMDAARSAGGGGGGGGAGGGRGGGFLSGLLGGIGPGILGMSTRASLIAGLAPAALGALPAIGGIAAGAGVGIAGLGALGLVGKGVTSQLSPFTSMYQQLQTQKMLAVTPAQQAAVATKQASLNQAVSQQTPAMQSIFHSINAISDQWQSFTKSLAPSLAKGFSQVPGLLKSFFPVFTASVAFMNPLIAGLKSISTQVVPGLVQAFHAAAPLLTPLLAGLGGLIKGLLPGMTAVMKSAMPAFIALSQILSVLGKDIGSMFAAFAPVIKQSSVIFKALMDVVSALFPIIGKLAAVFASALAPVFVAFASSIKSLLPFLTIVGKVLGALAGAILVDLAAAFTALATLLKDIAPSLAVLGKALGQVFTVLENSGAFAALGAALEKIAPVLAQTINQLVKQLAPELPVLITLASKFATILIDLLAAGLITVLQGLTGIMKAVPWLVPALGALAVAWWAVNLAMSANPVALIIIGIAALVGAVTLLVKHWKQVWTDIKNWARDAWEFLTHGWGQFLVPQLTLIRVTVDFVRNHWRQAWQDIKNWAADAWHFIWNGFGKFLLPLLGPVGMIAMGAILLYQHWKQIWGLIKQTGVDFYNWIWTDFGKKIYNFLTRTLPGYFDTAVTAIGKAWDVIKNTMKDPVNWVIRYVINDGLIKAFDWISSKVGGPDIKPVPTLARGGRLPGYGGGDQRLALLEDGETVIDKDRSRQHAWLFKMMGIPGYQGGGHIGPAVARFGTSAAPSGSGWGPIGDIFGWFKKAYDIGRITAAIASGNGTALTNAFGALIGKGGTGGATGDLATLLTDIPKTLIHDAVHWLISQFAGVAGGGGKLPGGGIAPAGSSAAANQAIARRLLPLFGWGMDQFAPLVTLWNGESGWLATAFNASSGATGIPQALPGSKMASAGADWRTNPVTQERWGMGYIRSVYGSPARALAMWLGRSPHWYDNGGWMGPGPNVSFNQTGQREAVLNPAQSRAFIDLGEAARLFARGQGAAGSGALMRDIHLTLPEGSTVAQALNEITYRLAAAQMSGYAHAGVLP